MTDIPSTQSLLLAVAIFLPLAACGGLYYLRRARWVIAGEQRVDASRFGRADLLIAGVLVLWFTLMVIQIFLGAPDALPTGAAKSGGVSGVSNDALYRTIAIHGLLVGGIAWSMQTRGKSVIEMFGLRRLPWRQIFKTGLIAYLAVWPLMKLITIFTIIALQEGAEKQAIVDYFFAAVRDHQWLAIGLTVFSAAIIAPISEEFVFRGYIYGVIKRYAGPLVGIIFTSALFAAVHFNALSLPSLFFFAIGLTLLYEVTGCLWVPMVVHCLFNTVSLLEMVLLSRIAS